MTPSQEAFSAASPEIQELAKRILEEERQVMHLKSRQGRDIHTQILNRIREAVQ